MTGKTRKAKKSGLQKLKPWLPLMLILFCLILIYSTGLHNYFSFENLKQHHQTLLSWKNNHYFWSALSFIMIYSLAVAISFPGATILTLIGGFLFGPIWGCLFIFFSAMLGAVIVYLAVKMAFSSYLRNKATGWITRLQSGFQKNAFSYLLFLRLVPLFPFWVINIVPALLDVPLRIYISATAIGILPGTIVYTMVGNGLSHVIENNQSPSLGIIFDPLLFYPLLGLAFLSLAPILYQRFKKQGKKNAR